MADRLHLPPRHRRTLDALLREHLPDVEVWAYGSRVNGRSHDGSDLDLVLRGPKLQVLPAQQLADFAGAVCESTIPFLVEARDWRDCRNGFVGRLSATILSWQAALETTLASIAVGEMRVLAPPFRDPCGVPHRPSVASSKACNVPQATAFTHTLADPGRCSAA